MAGLYEGQVLFKYLRRTCDGHRYDRASAFLRNLQASFMERQKPGQLLILITGTLRKYPYGYAGFYLLDALQDGLQSLFYVHAVQKQTIDPLHPGAQKGDL